MARHFIPRCSGGGHGPSGRFAGRATSRPGSGGLIMQDFFQFCDDKKTVGPPDKPGSGIGSEKGKILGTPFGPGRFKGDLAGFCRPNLTYTIISVRGGLR